MRTQKQINTNGDKTIKGGSKRQSLLRRALAELQGLSLDELRLVQQYADGLCLKRVSA